MSKTAQPAQRNSAHKNAANGSSGRRSPSYEDLEDHSDEDNDRRAAARDAAAAAAAPPSLLEAHLLQPPPAGAVRALRLTNVVGLCSQPFDAETYDPAEDAVRGGPSEGVGAIDQSSIIRWRHKRRPDGSTVPESNARRVVRRIRLAAVAAASVSACAVAPCAARWDSGADKCRQFRNASAKGAVVTPAATKRTTW